MSSKQIVVIVPVYNCKQYLEEYVESVEKQAKEYVDIILVDDGSTDGSDKLCDLLANKYDNINVLHKQNGGVSSARNLGIEYTIENYSSDTYVAFLDSDDAWHRDFFGEDILEMINKKYDLIGFQSANSNSSMTRMSNLRLLNDGFYNGGTNCVWKHATQHFGAMLYRLSLLIEYNVRFKLMKYSEDKIFSMSCNYLSKSTYLHSKLMYIYRNNELSAMHKRSFGIKYYAPIIEGYYNWNKEMVSIKQDEVKLLEGYKLMNIYVKDMILEEYIVNRNKDEIINYLTLLFEKYIKENTENLIENDTEKLMNISKAQVVKSIIKEKIKSFIKNMTRINLVRSLVEKRRYPNRL